MTTKKNILSFSKRKEIVADVLTQLTEILGRGNFTLQPRIVSGEEKTIQINVCENLREFLNSLVVKNTTGSPTKPVSETIGDTEYKRYRVREAVFLGAKEKYPDIGFLFEENLIKTGSSIAFPVKSMVEAVKLKENLADAVKQIIENLIAYTELEKDTAIDIEFETEA